MNPPDAPSPRDVTILIVEDSLTQALKLQHVLERNEYRVTHAANGRAAFAALPELRPTLVITDITMPEMDGYELCRRIKDDPALTQIPVILLTSLADPGDILKGLECGADNFIVKPYDEQFLLSRIQYVLANLELRRRAGGSRATEIYFAGHKYQLTAARIHSIDLLLSTYETAVQKNLELSEAKAQLEAQAEQLREKNAEMQADLEMARELQIAILPRQYPVFPANSSPDQSALRFCHRYYTSTQLGGDFYDVLSLSDTRAGVLICDVMGHGVRAALVTAIVRGLVEELQEVAHDPGRFLTAMNHSLCAILHQTATPLFATALYAVIDLASGTLRWANAGHPSPYHVRRSVGEVERLQRTHEGTGPAMGFANAEIYAEFECSIAPGDLLMLFTDGLYEIESASGAFYEWAQLTDAISRRLDLPTPELFDDLVAELRDFSATREFGDDMCVVGVDIVHLASGVKGAGLTNF